MNKEPVSSELKESGIRLGKLPPDDLSQIEHNLIYDPPKPGTRKARLAEKIMAGRGKGKATPKQRQR